MNVLSEFTAHGLLKYMHGMVICIDEALFPASGATCLITKLYSLTYKVSLVWCMWVAREFQAIFFK